MIIFIPTKGRVDNQLTLSNLPKELKANTFIVCPEKEAVWHRNKCDVLVQPDPNMGISAKRKWILETTSNEKIVMLDDDLRFAVRREDDPKLFREAKSEDIVLAFRELEDILDSGTPHAGFSVRGMGIGEAAQRGGWQEAKRMVYVLGYHVPTIIANVQLGRLSTHEDMDITLQLLTKGFPNMVNFSFVVDQKFGSKGGCSAERTMTQSNLDSCQLALFFPQFVRTAEKTYSVSQNRIEVVCQWQKALKYGREKK